MLNDDTGALHVDPRLLAHTAGQVLDTALELSTQALGLVVPAGCSLFFRFFREAEAAVEDARSTLDRLAAELSGDADKLYRTAFAALAAETAATRAFQ